MSISEIAQRTYTAKLFEAAGFKTAGTLDGYVDLAVPEGKTYQLTIDECVRLIAALHAVVGDIRANCLYDRDALLEKP